MSQQAGRQRDFSVPRNADIHSIVTPAEIRSNERVTAHVKIGDASDWVTARVWRLSPLGIEIVDDFGSTPSSGASLEVRLSIGKNLSTYSGTVVGKTEEPLPGKLIGIRFVGKVGPPYGDTERRKSPRWNCNPSFLPTCMTPNPVQFGDYVYGTVRNISSKGMQITTSLRNKHIVPGMNLELQLGFPMTAHVSITATVNRVSITSIAGKDLLELGLEFDPTTRTIRDSIGQYLLQFSDVGSVQALRDQGFSFVSIASGVDYYFVNTDEDYQRVLELRLIANALAKKIPEGYSINDMSDLFDTRGRIIAGRYRDQIAVSCRLHFSESGDPLEHESYISLPSDFPRRDQIMECARAATHPDYRGGDLWSTFIQHVAICAVQANRPWILLSTTEELIPMYSRIGFRKQNITYVDPMYPEMTQHLLLMPVLDCILGKSIDPFTWNIVWRDVADYILDSDIVDGDLLTSVRMRAYRILAPLTVIARFSRRRPRKNRNK